MRKDEKKKEIIFSDLKWNLKIPIIYSWFMTILYTAIFVYYFILGLFGVV